MGLVGLGVRLQLLVREHRAKVRVGGGQVRQPRARLPAPPRLVRVGSRVRARAWARARAGARARARAGARVRVGVSVWGKRVRVGVVGLGC